jgi:hypothetical protein
MIVQHGFDDLARLGSVDAIGVKHSQEHNRRLPECPAATPGPSRFVERQEGLEERPALAFQVGPSDDSVAGGVADRRGAEVDDGIEAAVLDEEVAHGYVTMEPDWRPGPVRRQRRIRHQLCSPGGGPPVASIL